MTSYTPMTVTEMKEQILANASFIFGSRIGGENSITITVHSMYGSDGSPRFVASVISGHGVYLRRLMASNASESPGAAICKLFYTSVRMMNVVLTFLPAITTEVLVEWEPFGVVDIQGTGLTVGHVEQCGGYEPDMKSMGSESADD